MDQPMVAAAGVIVVIEATVASSGWARRLRDWRASAGGGSGSTWPRNMSSVSRFDLWCPT